MRGAVGAGGEKPPATRLGDQYCNYPQNVLMCETHLPLLSDYPAPLRLKSVFDCFPDGSSKCLAR